MHIDRYYFLTPEQPVEEKLPSIAAAVAPFWPEESSTSGSELPMFQSQQPDETYRCQNEFALQSEEKGKQSIDSPQPPDGIHWYPNEYASLSKGEKKQTSDPKKVTLAELKSLRSKIKSLIVQQQAWEKERGIKVEQKIRDVRQILSSDLEKFFNDHFARLGETSCDEKLSHDDDLADPVDFTSNLTDESDEINRASHAVNHLSPVEPQYHDATDECNDTPKQHRPIDPKRAAHQLVIAIRAKMELIMSQQILWEKARGIRLGQEQMRQRDELSINLERFFNDYLGKN